MRLIFLDANFLLIPAQNFVDIYSQFSELIPNPWKLVIISAIFDELEKKINQYPNKTKLRREYQLSRQILEKQDYQLEKVTKESTAYVDDILLKKAVEMKHKGNVVYIATNDGELRKKCRSNEIHAIFLRQKKKLEVE
jgi:rRNA-processing protein FCF1